MLSPVRITAGQDETNHRKWHEAMAAKVASHPWSIEELYEKVMATVEA